VRFYAMSTIRLARGGPLGLTTNQRSACTAGTSGTSAPLPSAIAATESSPPGVIARYALRLT